MIGKRGLTAVSTGDLKAMLRALHREELTCPITQLSLASAGFLRLGDDLELLQGLDRPAVRAVLVAVLYERG